MNPTDRQKKILELLRSLQKEWHVKELADHLDVSELTIRRDLDLLAKEGGIIRTHGGCIPAGIGSRGSFFYQQIEKNFKLKQAIGQEAAKLVKPGDTILLGDGSTIFQLVANLGDCSPLTIYTNSIGAIQELKATPNQRVHILGGEYDYEYNMLFLKGSMTNRILETLHFDLVFIGTDSISKDGSCLTRTEEVAHTNQIVLRRGDRKILISDHTKLNAPGNVIYGKLGDFDLWITTTGIDENLMRVFRKLTTVKEVNVNNHESEKLNV